MNNENNIKIDNLVKIGVAMVLLSGIIFATTTWNYITDIFKVLILILGGISFRCVAYVTEEKLKLEKSSFGYWIISCLFFVFSLISAGYFKLLGEWYSFTGDGSYFLLSNIFLLMAVIFLEIYHKKKNKDLLYVWWGLIHLSTYLFLYNFLKSSVITILIMSILIFIINFIKDKNVYVDTLIDTNRVVIYVLSFSAVIVFDKSLILNFIVLVSMLLNLFYKKFVVKYNGDDINVMLPIITSSLVIRFMSTINFEFFFNCLLIILLLSVIATAFGFVKEKLLSNVSFIFNDFVIAIILMILATNNSAYFLIGSILLLVINLISLINENSEFELLTNPFKIFILCMSSCNFIHDNFSINSNLLFTLSSFVFLMTTFSYSNKTLKNISYFINLLIVLGISMSIYNKDVTDTITLLLLLVNTVINAVIVDKKLSDFKFFNYLYTLLFMYIFINNYFADFGISICLITISSFTLLSLYKIDENKTSLKVSLLANAIPMMQLTSFDLDIDFVIILISLYSIFMAYLYENVFKPRKMEIARIFYIIPMIILFFSESFLNTIILGSLLVIYIMYFNNKDEYISLYKGSVIELIIMIIVKLIDFWSNIPTWFYLFVGGIAIIVFVTKKELNKDSNIVTPTKKIETTKPKEVERDKSEINFCTQCGEPLYGKKNYCSNCGKKSI
ncbi:MAG: zinc ribbon domain-containing protein [Firmicutes bacterium]|nr:zinc ribbon domain-containing protein [Bacillota bacterium]